MVAGKGGFNLTHGEDISEMLKRYSTPFIHDSILNFTNNDLIDWLKNTGITTYKGSSNRIFPTKEIKPADVLAKIIGLLNKNGINIHFNSSWVGYDANKLKIKQGDTITSISGDYTIYALGGKSWAKTGSDGNWVSLFPSPITIVPFEASNCGYLVNWNNQIIEKLEGKPIKNIAVSINGVSKKGELLVTKRGLEGGAIYALSPQIRASLNSNKDTLVNIDLKPTVTNEQLINSIQLKRTNQSWKDFLTKVIKLDKTHYSLFIHYTPKEVYQSSEAIINAIKSLKIPITGSNPIDEAISTVGGISPDELSENFELDKLPNHYIIGEMIDWDAPTGGYLLQACFSMGVYLAQHFNIKKDR